MLLKLFHHCVEIGIACAKLPCEPVPAPLDNPFAARDYIELASLTGREDGIDSKALLNEGHETRDLSPVVLSGWAVNDLDFHSGSEMLNVVFEAYAHAA